jgi:hypothetical protein
MLMSPERAREAVMRRSDGASNRSLIVLVLELVLVLDFLVVRSVSGSKASLNTYKPWANPWAWDRTLALAAP